MTTSDVLSRCLAISQMVSPEPLHAGLALPEFELYIFLYICQGQNEKSAIYEEAEWFQVVRELSMHTVRIFCEMPKN